MRLHVATRSIAPSGGYGGLERAAADHADRMSGLGIEVCVHAPLVQGASAVRVDWPRFTRPRSVLMGMNYLMWTRRLLLSLKSCYAEGDVVHFHGSSVFALASSLGRGSVRAVVNPHGMEEFDTLSLSTVLVRPLLRFMTRSGARRVNRVIVTDASLTGKVRALLRVPSSRLVLIPNSVNPAFLRSLVNTSPPPAGESSGYLLVVSVGRVERNKGYDLLAQALSGVPDIPWRWTHYGSGSQLENVWAPVRAAGLADRFQVVEQASDREVQQALSQASLFVQPSRSEGSSLTTLEAMTHGTLALGTRVGGIPDKIEDGVNGLLADPDAESLRRGIVTAAELLAKDPHRVSRMRRAAMATVDSRFSISQTDELYRALYDEVLSE